MKRKSVAIGHSKSKHILLIFFSVLICCLIYQLSFRTVKFKEVSSNEIETTGHHYVYYCRISENDLDDLLNTDYNFDFENHTYIITFGYELKKIKYSPFSKPSIHNYNYFVPKVYLDENKKEMCYVYELSEKLNINYDMHGYKKKVYFI